MKLTVSKAIDRGEMTYNEKLSGAVDLGSLQITNLNAYAGQVSSFFSLPFSFQPSSSLKPWVSEDAFRRITVSN